MSRPYIAHVWIAADEDAECLVCGISGLEWEWEIQNAAMIRWDCSAVRERNDDGQGR